jgi:dihydrolipoamide dehydrogenase
MTSDQALAMSDLPSSAVIIGGSVIGVEFASVWKSFGVDVTIVEALPRLVPVEDEVLSKNLERAFRKRKIGLQDQHQVRVGRADRLGDHLSLSRAATPWMPTCCWSRSAAGRRPTAWASKEAGVTLDRGLGADRRAAADRTSTGSGPSATWCPGLQLAHRGFAHGIFVAEEIAGLNPMPVVDSGIPRVTYCNPEVASVGLTEAQAKEQYGEVETYEYNLAATAAARSSTPPVSEARPREGRADRRSPHDRHPMGEQVGEASLTVNWEAYPEDVAQFIHAHPTQNESLGEAALALAGKPLHAHN